MQRFIGLLFLFALITCDGRPPGKEAAAAQLLAREHAARELKPSAAGSDCRVLLIEIETRFDDDLVESIHYGTGDYGAFGGVEQFAHDRRFRAVVYRDANEGLWTFGATTRDEARSISPCE